MSDKLEEALAEVKAALAEVEEAVILSLRMQVIERRIKLQTPCGMEISRRLDAEVKEIEDGIARLSRRESKAK